LRSYSIAFIFTTVVFLVLDFVWLGFIAKDFYRTQIGPLMLEKPLLGVAFAFYFLYAFGDRQLRGCARARNTILGSRDDKRRFARAYRIFNLRFD
jgi:Predicted membrane protein (DUF2177)